MWNLLTVYGGDLTRVIPIPFALAEAPYRSLFRMAIPISSSPMSNHFCILNSHLAFSILVFETLFLETDPNGVSDTTSSDLILRGMKYLKRSFGSFKSISILRSSLSLPILNKYSTLADEFKNL